MGIFTFFLYLLIFIEILILEEYTEREYRGTEIIAGCGMIVTLLLWVCHAFDTLQETFVVFQWISFLYFTWRHFMFFREWRKDKKSS